MAFNIGRVQRYEQECIIESQKAEIRLLKKQLLQRDQGKKNTDIIGDMISKTGLDEAGDIDLNEKEAKAKVKQNDKDIIIIDNGNDVINPRTTLLTTLFRTFCHLSYKIHHYI